MQLPCQWWAIDRSCNVNQRAEASRLSHLCRIRIRARNTTKIVPLSRPWGDDARVPLATMPGVSLEICTDRQVSWWPLAARSPAPTFTQEIISPYNSRLKLPITMHFSLILKCSSVLCQTVDCVIVDVSSRMNDAFYNCTAGRIVIFMREKERRKYDGDSYQSRRFIGRIVKIARTRRWKMGSAWLWDGFCRFLWQRDESTIGKYCKNNVARLCV